MAFSEIELKLIDSTVGELCRRVPRHVKNQLRYSYEIEGHNVSLFEERPHWKSKGEWTKTGVATFRYFRSRGEWKLYWMRRDLKWHQYDPEVSKSRSLKVLVAVVEEDKWGAFFG
jgi:hypothetical protein